MLSLFFLRVGYISTLSKAKYFVQIYRGNCLLFVLEDDSHTSFLVAGKPFFIGPICLQSELHIVNVEWLFSATFYNTLALFLWGGKWNTGTIAEKLCCICIDLWREFPRENYFKTPLSLCNIEISLLPIHSDSDLGFYSGNSKMTKFQIFPNFGLK